MDSFLKGSQWRRWDLHIHTPETKLSDGYIPDGDEDVWERYIEMLENSPVQAFGITDYYSCDSYFKLIEKYKEKYPKTKKVFFCNIELRFAEAISKDDKNPDVHVIFDNDLEKCSEEKIRKFLSTLEVLGTTQAGATVHCSDLKETKDYESASVNIKALKEALIKTFGDDEPYLIAFPANNDGIRSTDKESPRKVKASDTMDNLASLFFGNQKNKEWFLREDRYEEGKSEPKPVVSGSDCHSFADLDRLEGNVNSYPPTWIKADLTFRGLTQICFEPDARVYIGAEPPVEMRKNQQAIKFISRLTINQLSTYDERNGQWFKDVNIPVNPELTAIIGNKGSGKSALVDIMGLLGESRQEPYFSFLTNDPKNKKFKQNGYAENFKADLEWQSTTKSSKILSENIDRSKPEAVRYLPQNYFEQLTNEIEIEEFRREIEDVVFSHVEETDRMGKTNFKDLQDFKTLQSTQEISSLKTALRELNIEIVKLEKEKDPFFKRQVEEQLKVKRNELTSLDKTKPVEVPKPDGEDEEQKQLSQQISSRTEQINKVAEAGKKTTELIAQRKTTLQKLTTLQQELAAISVRAEEEKENLRAVCIELGLDIDAIVNVGIKTKPVTEKIEALQSELNKLEQENEIVFSDDIDFEELESLPDLKKAYVYIKEKITELKEKLGTPQRKYQTYLDKLAKWTSQREEVIGNDDAPKEGTIKYLDKQISYIEDELSSKLEDAYVKRKEIAKKIFDSKKQVRDFYADLKKSVEDKLSAVQAEGFFVNIKASFVLERSFTESFLSYINKTKRGSFHGSNEPINVLKKLISLTDWNDFNSVYSFIDKAIEKLKFYEGEEVSVSEQVNDVKELYDFLFSLGYFHPRYELRLGKKNLNELSPGEKGLLLLVFYLQLDRDNIPLIIDQPEDNLDNESIFTVLATCIRKAKQNRQVILVTHNPNLAVGADAEQVIYVQLEKANNYKFSYEAGAIENPRINQKIIDVLEGTQPAFVKRRLKYQIQ